MEGKSQDRPPPKQLVKLQIENGDSKAKMIWEPRSGVISLAWTGGPGNAVALSRKFDRMKVERASDFIRVAHEFLSTAFGEKGASEDVRKMVGSMMSMLPEEREPDASEEKGKGNEPAGERSS